MADTLINDGGAYVPPDLLNDASTPDLDKDFFDVVITDLKPDTIYSLQFAWVYEDKTTSKYSPGYTVRTAAETFGVAPSFGASDLLSDAGIIAITWDGKDANGQTYKNFDRIEYYITDSTNKFGDGTTPSGSFKSKGTYTVAAPAGTYTVWLVAVSTLGKKSPESAHETVTVATSAIPIDPPTLPTGLSAATTSFGISVNWNGTYASTTFNGFKSVKIYASTTDLGSTVSSLAESSLVGNLTVDRVTNRLNIGLDNLRQATGTTASSVYTTGVYLYYIAVNLNNEVYKVSGTPVYTRINSTSIYPTKANLIDLENGLISIENLVAGNGQFTSWLRAGSSTGGARIELNGGASFTNGGNAVLPGLTVYGTGNNPIFRASLDGIVSFGGYAPSDIAAINTAASSASSAASAASSAATAASNTATAAQGTANAAANASQNFDSSGNIDKSIVINTMTGNIRAGKSSYIDDSTNGWFIGYSGDNVPKINIGNGTNSMKWNGSSLVIKGSLESSTFSLNGNESTNYWTASAFRAGSSSTYISVNSGTGETIMYSSPTQTEISETGSSQSTTSISIPQQLIVNSSTVTIQGLPGVGNGLVANAYSSLEPFGSGVPDAWTTQYRSQGYSVAGNEPSYNYGAAARYRMVVADPYDYNKLKRGLGVYYGTRTGAPGASTGFVGDLWVSW